MTRSVRLILYPTDHFGIHIVPANILLIVATSWLVGAGASLASVLLPAQLSIVAASDGFLVGILVLMSRRVALARLCRL